MGEELGALRDFSENLLQAGYQDDVSLMYLLLMKSLEYLGATRATLYRYENRGNTLYNQKTVVFKDGRQVAEDHDSKLSRLSIDLKADYRAEILRRRHLAVISSASTRSRLNLETDKTLGIVPEDLMIYPVCFNGGILLVIEIAREKTDPPFDATSADFLSVLFNFSSALFTNMALYEWAIRDTLTGCYALSYFNRACDELILDVQRSHTGPFCFAILDIDHFKKINDTFGHSEGDRAIRFFADTIRQVLRENDVFARYGGDEFLILFKNCTLESASQVIERVRELFKTNPFEIAGVKQALTTSCGLVRFGEHGEDRETLFRNADAALYQVKQNGRDALKIFQNN